MDTLAAGSPALAVTAERAEVEVVVPVHNEEGTLERSVVRLRRFLDTSFPFPSVLTIADNASTDATLAIACRLAAELSRVKVLRTKDKGRGRALRAAWSESRAPVVAYMDVDLSTGLDALLPLVAPLVSGHSDVAIGTRFSPGSRVVRGPKREFLSRVYNLVVRGALGNSFSDAQCGFKALRREVAAELVPQVADDAWFFDTELLVLAERRGLRIHEVPVDWVDDPDSKVAIIATAWGDLKGVARLALSGAPGAGGAARAGQRRQLHRLGGVGMVSTVSYLVLFLALTGTLGVWWADVVALVMTSVANTATHRLLAHEATAADELASTGALVLVTNLVLTLVCLAATVAAFGTGDLALATGALLGTLLAGAVRVLLWQGRWQTEGVA